jgi:hypothetical protein
MGLSSNRKRPINIVRKSIVTQMWTFLRIKVVAGMIV